MADFLGIGYEIWGLFIIIAIPIAIILRRRGPTSIRAMPVKVLWELKNGAAYLLPAKEDLNGVFVDVVNARGKKILSLMKEGQPIEVKEPPEKDAKQLYLIGGPHNGKKGGRDSDDDDRPYLDVNLSRTKSMRLYRTMEKSGQTLPWGAEDGQEVNLHGSTVNQETATVNELLKRMEENIRNTFRALIMPILTGVSLGSMATFLLLIVLGRIR